MPDLFTANNDTDERQRYGEFYEMNIAETIALKREINWQFNHGGISLGEWFRRSEQGTAWLRTATADARAVPGTWGGFPESADVRFVPAWGDTPDEDQEDAA